MNIINQNASDGETNPPPAAPKYAIIPKRIIKAIVPDSGGEKEPASESHDREFWVAREEEAKHAMVAARRRQVEAISLEEARAFLTEGHDPNRVPIAPLPKLGALPLPDIIDVTDFLGTPIPKPPELVHGLLHKGSKMVLSGSSKTRKTWSLTHLGICVASGQPWWGLPTTRGKVLYANFEVQNSFFQERVRAIKDKLMIEAGQLKGQMSVWNLKGHAADITGLADEIVARTKDQFDLVILDPIYKVLGDRDENSNSDIGDLMNQLDRIIVQTGAAVIFGHHFSKGNQAKKEAMDRMSGAGAFARDVDTMLMLTKHEQPDTYTVEAITRNHKPLDSFCVTLEHPIMVRNDAANPTKIKQQNGRDVKFPIADLLKAIDVQELSRADLERQYRAATGASEGTFDKLFKEAKEAGKLVPGEDPKKWKASTPYFPIGYNACRAAKEENSATVQ